MEQHIDSGYHTNKFSAKGVLTHLDAGTGRSGVRFLNITLKVDGKKYVETIPCVAYGALVDAIMKTSKVGDTVTAYGRIRSHTKDDRVYISLVCEQLDVLKY